MRKALAIVMMCALCGCAASAPRLNEPFPMLVGETKRVGPDGFEITLRSVSDDSGCLSATDCSTMMFQGSIGVRMGEKSDLIRAGAIMKPGQVLRLDLKGYAFHLTDIRRNSRNQIEATFVVLGQEDPAEKK